MTLIRHIPLSLSRPRAPHHIAIIAVKVFSTFFFFFLQPPSGFFNECGTYTVDEILKLTHYFNHSEGNYVAESFNSAAGCHSGIMKCFA